MEVTHHLHTQESIKKCDKSDTTLKPSEIRKLFNETIKRSVQEFRFSTKEVRATEAFSGGI